MRLVEYMINQSHIPEIISSIKKDCKPWLSEMSKPIYRGHDYNEDFGSAVPRSNRRPMNTPQEVSDRFDTLSQILYGWKPRREGLFCTTQPDTAISYGKNYMIFPVGHYKYLYSEEIYDFFINGREKLFPVGIYNTELKEQLNDMKKYYKDKGLNNTETDEVMIKCDKYYYVRSTFIPDDILKSELGMTR